jgi:hypothetical protein
VETFCYSICDFKSYGRINENTCVILSVSILISFQTHKLTVCMHNTPNKYPRIQYKEYFMSTRFLSCKIYTPSKTTKCGIISTHSIPCIKELRIIQIPMKCTTLEAFNCICLHQHVSVTVVIIFRVSLGKNTINVRIAYTRSLSGRSKFTVKFSIVEIYEKLFHTFWSDTNKSKLHACRN